jgi:hypothetical protein
MAKVYGTNGHDLLGWRGLFDRDGVTDGDDTIFGLGGDDWIQGRDGNDFLQGGEGADLLFGGDGIDTANYGDSRRACMSTCRPEKGKEARRKAISSIASKMLPARGGTIISSETSLTTYCPDGSATTTSRRRRRRHTRWRLGR